MVFSGKKTQKAHPIEGDTRGLRDHLGISASGRAHLGFFNPRLQKDHEDLFLKVSITKLCLDIFNGSCCYSKRLLDQGFHFFPPNQANQKKHDTNKTNRYK